MSALHVNMFETKREDIDENGHVRIRLSVRLLALRRTNGDGKELK